MSSIDQFKTVFTKRSGAAMQNRFSLLITPPAAVQLSGNDASDISLLCESCSLPGRQITTLDYQFLQNSFKVPNGFLNEEVTFTFILTNDYFAKKLFDAWANQVVDFENYKVKYVEDYRGTIEISQLVKGEANGEEKVAQKVILDDAFPTTIGTISLDNNAENTIQRFTVSVAYKNFRII